MALVCAPQALIKLTADPVTGHASTMVGLALVDRGARRVALADAGIELALAAAGVLTATQY